MYYVLEGFADFYGTALYEKTFLLCRVYIEGQITSQTCKTHLHFSCFEVQIFSWLEMVSDLQADFSPLAALL